MCQTRREISLGFTPEKFTEGQHILYIYNDDKERRNTMAKYISSGLSSGEKTLYLADSITPAELINTLEDQGLDMQEHKNSCVINEASTSYCPTGYFSADDMLDVVGEFYQSARNEGFTGARGTGEMTWALKEGRAQTKDLLEYEVKLTGILEQYPYTACCQYDAREFDGSTLMDMLSIHPVMIVQGQLVKNPYFMSADEFMNRTMN
jgi:DcmR-like sensory protein